MKQLFQTPLAVGLALTSLAGCSLIFDSSPQSDPDATTAIDASTRLCGIDLEDTTSYYTVDGEGRKSTLTDTEGENTALVVEKDANRLQEASLIVGDGPSPDCNEAVHLDGLDPAFVRVPYELLADTVSFDFWFRTKAVPRGNSSALLVRDAQLSSVGDMGVFVYRTEDSTPVHHVVFRIQDEDTNYYACSQPIEIEEWHHVGVSVDPNDGAQLFVNGVESGAFNPTISNFLASSIAECHASASAITATLENNNNDWFWGASNHQWDGTVGTNPASNALNGELDELRFRSQRITEEQALRVYQSIP